MSDWDLIVALLYWRGSCNRLLSGAARRRVWGHADGYGKMSSAELQRLELLGDWSHIRDSSPEGQRMVVGAIRTELMEMDLRRNAQFPELAEDGHHMRIVREVVAHQGTTVEA